MGVLYRKEEILGMSDKTFTIQDILALPEGQRAELLDGKMYLLASPGLTHQRLLLLLYDQISRFIRKRKGACETLLAPVSVYLTEDEKTYVEPDLMVICDKNKLDEQGCHGAPDWIIEIVSPSSKSMDYYKKLSKYQESGVREYWIVDPLKSIVVVYHLEQEEPPVIYPLKAKVPSGLFPDLEVSVSDR